ncbi:metallophosphoesterase family protein [Sutcliffiella deserti]|uniref:metallophosphoesterase family protein n=1 Tax=Sutcliffiella deserti TaxID=2875501 RepID=UPI001CC07B35|nr:DNA repair exonuclease [Sutcliffiella deserti]
MTNSIRFIHAADLHLDSPFKGLNYLPNELFERVRASTFDAFTRVVDVALEERVDFLLLAGDLFDLEQRSLLAQAKLREEFLRLAKFDIPVYVIHGNHDYITERQQRFRYPDNVHIFGETVAAVPFIKNGIPAANIYGFSYSTRHILHNRTSEYQKQDNVPYHIGLLHGNLSGREDHDPYAPFSISDLLAKDFQYWALGHIHKREILHPEPPIVYPGNIQGRNKKEIGEKGCYLVELSNQKPKLTFIKTSKILWENMDLSIRDLQTMDELLQKAKEIYDENRKSLKGTLLHLTLTGSGPLFSLLQEESQLEDLKLFLNEREPEKEDFQYVYSLTNHTTPEYSKESLKKKPFYEDFYKILEENANIDPFLTSLFQHSDARGYLEPFHQTEKQAILEEAEQWIVSQLMDDGGRGDK